MKKLYITADMEGVSGIIDPTFINPKDPNYTRGRELMTEEVNIVVQSALEWGVEEVFVNDSHHQMNNILIEKLHPRANLISGSPKPFSMMQGLDETFDGVFFLGYHTRNGAPGVLSHTMSHVIKNLIINGTIVGEFGINVLLAEYYKVPALLVTGDQELAKEVNEIVPNIPAAIVKRAFSRTSAHCLPPEKRKQVLQEMTVLALKNCQQASQPNIKQPFNMEIEFFHYGEAEMASLVPGSKQKDCTVSFESEDAREIYKAMRAMMNLADSARFF
jgi:D-amino peptidase